PQPSARRDVGAIYDPLRDRIVVSGTGTKAWALGLAPGSSWVQVNPFGYPSTLFERAVYDPANDRMVLINSDMRVATMQLSSPSSWIPLGVVGPTPPPRSFFAATLDQARDRLLIFGGGPYTGIFGDVWALNLTGSPTWTRLDPGVGGPTPAWGPLA